MSTVFPIRQVTLLSLYPTGTSAQLASAGNQIAIHFSHSPITTIIITSVYSFFLHISALFWFGPLSNLALEVWHKHRLLASGEISSTRSLKIWFKIDISTVIIQFKNLPNSPGTHLRDARRSGSGVCQGMVK